MSKVQQYNFSIKHSFSAYLAHQLTNQGKKCWLSGRAHMYYFRHFFAQTLWILSWSWTFSWTDPCLICKWCATLLIVIFLFLKNYSTDMFSVCLCYGWTFRSLFTLILLNVFFTLVKHCFHFVLIGLDFISSWAC